MNTITDDTISIDEIKSQEQKDYYLQNLDEPKTKSLSDSYKIELINSKTGEVLTEKEYLKLMNKKIPFKLGSYKQKRKVK